VTTDGDHQRRKARQGRNAALADEQQPFAGRWSWLRWGPRLLPSGASAGDCLHRILERVDHQLPGRDPATKPAGGSWERYSEPHRG